MDFDINPERDHFPWVAGALAAMTTVIAIGIGVLNHGSAPRVSMRPGIGTELLPMVAATAAPRILVDPPANPPARAVVAGPAVPEARAARQVWECVANGLHIFSDAPCGAGAVPREIAEPNRMNAAPSRADRVPYGAPPGPYGAPSMYYSGADAAPVMGFGGGNDGPFADESVATGGESVLFQPYVVRSPARRPRYHQPAAQSALSMRH